jgi:hypothetical protein
MSEVLESSWQLWQSLVQSGLQETRKNLLPGYDAELAELLKDRFYPGSSSSLDHLLRKKPPSVEAFLDAFFGALKPFSQMLRDVLAMFEGASAKRSDENLRIAFDFDKASVALALTLREFREIEKFFRSIARPVVVREWNSNTLGRFSQEVREAVDASDPNLVDRKREIRDIAVRQFVENNGHPAWLPFPGFPRSGDVTLDNALGMTERLIEEVLSEVRKLGPTYREFSDRLADLPWEDDGDRERPGDIESMREERDGELPRRSFVAIVHDFWPNYLAEYVCLGVEAIGNSSGDRARELTARLNTVIQDGFSRPPRFERTRMSLEQDFRDLVNLPIWEKRHELYAVWVASRIADALSGFDFEWHPDGDTLSFPFSGAELATFRDARGGTNVFWTEKRTELAEGGLFGRKHIQPDYRIMTMPTHRADATSLVVECKQYLKGSRKNFGAALDDYAKGCHTAPVILVNYGPADSNILRSVDRSRRDRTRLIGDFKPGNDTALSTFRNHIQSIYPAPPRLGPGEIVLQWTAQYCDLDLHLFICGGSSDVVHHIGHRGTDGSLDTVPWAHRTLDVLEGPGIERITILRWMDAEYHFLVHDYSGTNGFPVGDVTVSISYPENHVDRKFDYSGRAGRWWWVFSIDGASGQVTQINQALSDCPFTR